MSIIIKELLSSSGEKCYCKVLHGKNRIEADVFGEEKIVSKLLNKEVVVEIDFDEILAAQEIHDFKDSDSSIKEINGETVLIGKVHSIIEEKEKIYDIYIQSGPEFIAVTENEWNIEPHEGAGVKINVSKLCFYLTNT